MSYSMFTDEEVDKIYEMKHIHAYERIEDPVGWECCSKCGVLPRTWIFNNGSWATCLCFRMYDDHPVRTESIISVYTRTGLTAEYKRDNLRLAWNKYVTTGEMQNKLPEGQW